MTPRKSTEKQVDAHEPTMSAMRLRLDLGASQARKLSDWLFIAHHFRNAAVGFITARRRERSRWFARHKALAKDWVPDEFKVNDATACSSWLTQVLEETRAAAAKEFNLTCGKLKVGREVDRYWNCLTREEQAELRKKIPHIEWLRVPRTVLDQVVQDLGRTIAKAISDRATNKLRRSRGLKPIKAAGFPGFQKWQHANGIRLQVVAERNTDYREGWARAELVVPGLGRLKVQESGYAWPKTPAKMLSITRDAANRWHVAFVCVSGEGLGARARRLARQGQVWEPLPVDPDTGLPAIEGMDASMAATAVSSSHGELGRKRYLKSCANRLRFANKSVARKQKGSGRWKKAVRKLGKLHARVANLREVDLRQNAQVVASRSAIVCIEDFSPKFLLANKKLAASAQDLAWGKFTKLLEQECAKRGHLLIKAGKFDPTTQMCPTPGCDYKNTALKGNLSIRSWTCPQCNQTHDRDLAASCNVLDFALARYLDPSTQAESVCGTHPLHPELAEFISRGGLTALVRSQDPSGSRQAGAIPPGLGRADEPWISLSAGSARLERAMNG